MPLKNMSAISRNFYFDKYITVGQKVEKSPNKELASSTNCFITKVSKHHGGSKYTFGIFFELAVTEHRPFKPQKYVVKKVVSTKILSDKNKLVDSLFLEILHFF